MGALMPPGDFRPDNRRMWRIGQAAALLFLAAAAPVPEMALTAVNATREALECHALAGHWYGFNLGIVAAGDTLKVTLGLDRTTAVASLQNATGQAVPIEQIYCGRIGEAWRTRAMFDLRHLIDVAMRGLPVAVTCRADARLICD